MMRTSRTWVWACLFAMLGIVAAPARAQGPSGDSEKLLVGYEIDEMKPADGRGTFYKVGKVWPGGGVQPGWRFDDHEAEFKLPDGHDGDVTIYQCQRSSSRDTPMISLFRKGATQGKHAKRWTPLECEAGSWPHIERALKDNQYGYWPPPGVPSHSDKHPYYFFQRYCKVWRYETGNDCDWSAWDRLRFDVLAPDAPVVLGVFLRDKSGPKLSCGPIGVRTDVAVFRIPAGEQVTVDFPIREMAAVAELDLTQIYRYQCRLNGYEGATDIFFDNIRLAKKDAPARHKLIAMQGKPKPFARPVYYKPVQRDAELLKREKGPVEPLGPIDIGPYTGIFTNGYGHLGGSGGTYFQNTRRGCVAYDNKRLLIIFGTGGLRASTSFDGGATWGGLTADEKEPAKLAWGLRANVVADAGGDVYMIGTPNCDSYNEGHDICMFRLVFTGSTWADGYFSHLGQNGYKCTAWARALQLPNGRIWAAWCDGWARGEALAKFSDDDGQTWSPCKDAAVQSPRPMYQPALADLAKPVAQRPKPPEQVLLWPASMVAGPLLVPYGDSVAALALDSRTWQVHDGENWGPLQKGPAISGRISEAVPQPNRILIAGADKGTLRASELKDGVWSQPVELDTGVGDSIMTASGESVFCFYVKVVDKRNEVRYRRWTDGRWEESKLITTEDFTVNHVASPTRCPPDYAAVWWDERVTSGRVESRLRFARIPNR